MGRKRQSAGRVRGRGGRGQDAGHEESGRGQGRSRGGSGGRGREQTQPGSTSRTGFVPGGELVDWENSTPNRRQSNGRGGRTSSKWRGSQNRAGVTRPAAQNNPFTFVSFDYTQLNRRRGGITSSASNVSLPEEVRVAVSGDREVVVPAIEGRVEVYMDRKGCQEALEALESETRTTGLGFVDQESAGCIDPIFEAEDSGNIADSELHVSQDRNVAVLEAMTVDTEPENYLHLRNSDIHEENFRSGAKKKNRRGSSFETPSVKGRNAGYLSIGGVKVFTEAGITFSDESENLDEELGLHSSSGKNRREQAKQRGQWLEDTFSGSEESVVDSSDDSDVDDDLVEDYLANVEGANEMLDASWLLKKKLRQHVAVEDMGSEDDSEDEDDDEDNTSTDNTSDHDSSDSGCASPGERMWSLMKRQSKGKELMDIDDDDLDSELEDMAEKMLFGGSNTRHERKSKTTSLLRNLELEDSEEDFEDDDDVDQLFDLMEDAHFMPDKMPKTPGTGKQASGSIGKSIEPMAWPLSVHKSKKKSKKFPGQKKRERKEMIAAKRQERTRRRGLDLQAINSELEDIVLHGTDMYAFAPMEDRDRKQIHRMAAIYRLTSASQGLGKKRFTVVTRTKHTSLPTGADKYRLAAMLDKMDGNSSMPLTGVDRRMAKKFKNVARQAFLNMQTPTPKRNGKKHQKLTQGEGLLYKSKSKKSSSGQNSTEKNGGKKLQTPKYANNPMSFILCGTIDNEEKSATLGFGAISASVQTEIESFSMTSERGEASTSRSSSSTVVKVKVAATTIGTFEAHTKGFGSRMMSKMGFVEGQGLGRDGQGINSPLEAVKRPKSLGLGAYAPPPAN